MNRFFLILLFCGLAGCNPVEKISVLRASVPTLDGLSSLHGEAILENRGSRDVTVDSARFTVRYRGRELGTARLVSPVGIPARQTTSIRYDLALDGVSLSSIMLLPQLVPNPEAFTVDATGYARLGRMRKKIVMKEVGADRIVGIILNFTP